MSQQSRIRCNFCFDEMNVAVHIVGTQQSEEWPDACPKCGSTQFTKIAENANENAKAPALGSPR